MYVLGGMAAGPRYFTVDGKEKSKPKSAQACRLVARSISCLQHEPTHDPFYYVNLKYNVNMIIFEHE